MSKNAKTILKIFSQSIGLYFTNIDRFAWYMFFPVIGQLFGMLATIIILYSYNEYKAILLGNMPILKNPTYMTIALCIVLMPIVILWIKSVWDYFVAYAAVNSMTENMLKSERVYDFPAHTLMVSRRWLEFLGLIIIYISLLLLSIIPIFTVFAWVLLIFYSFIFQIFIFEPDLSPVECFKRSSSYVNGNFKQTLLLILLIGGLTYLIFPQIILTFLDTVKSVAFLKAQLVPYISVPSLDWINWVLSAMGIKQIMPDQVALFLVRLTIIVLVIQFLLPLRVICMCLWYKNFYNVSGSMKKIDDRILNRAMNSKKRRKN